MLDLRAGSDGLSQTGLAETWGSAPPRLISTAAVAKEKDLDVQATAIDGSHMSAASEAMRQSIAFFEKTRVGK